MGGFPALMIRPPESPIQQLGQVEQVIGARQQQQIRGQELQSGNIDLQMKQLALKNMQTVQSALSDPNLENQYNEWNQSKGKSAGSIASDMGVAGELHPMAQFLAEKKGLPFLGPGGALEVSNNFNKAAQETANLLKTQGEVKEKSLANYGKQLDYFADDAAPILAETDPAKQESALATLKAKINFQPTKYPPAVAQGVDDINSVHDLATLANSAKIHKEVISLGTERFNEQKAQAEALLKTRAASGISDSSGVLSDRASAMLRGIESYQAIPPNERTALANEFKNSPDWETAEKVVARADATNQSFQRSADARHQADMMRSSVVGQAMAQHLVVEDKDLQTSLNATSGIRQELDMSKGGNQMASAAAITRFAEHEVKAGGINRFNETELRAIGTDAGSWGRRLQTWIDKGRKGTPPEGTVNEINSILDLEDRQAHTLHDNNVDVIQNRYSAISNGGIAPAPARPPAAAGHPFFSQFGGTVRP